MLGAAEFEAMPAHGHYVCICRGGIADGDALLEAVQSGQVAGAGLDAHDVEPLPPESPFWDLPNVILTPHDGATTPVTKRRGVEIMLENLRRFAAGEPPLNLVDKTEGC